MDVSDFLSGWLFGRMQKARFLTLATTQERTPIFFRGGGEGVRIFQAKFYGTAHAFNHSLNTVLPYILLSCILLSSCILYYIRLSCIRYPLVLHPSVTHMYILLYWSFCPPAPFCPAVSSCPSSFSPAYSCPAYSCPY